MSGKPSYPAPLPITITPGMHVVDVSDNGGVIAGITEDSVIYRPTVAPESLLVGRWSDVAICGTRPGPSSVTRGRRRSPTTEWLRPSARAASCHAIARLDRAGRRRRSTSYSRSFFPRLKGRRTARTADEACVLSFRFVRENLPRHLFMRIGPGLPQPRVGRIVGGRHSCRPSKGQFVFVCQIHLYICYYSLAATVACNPVRIWPQGVSSKQLPTRHVALTLATPGPVLFLALLANGRCFTY